MSQHLENQREFNKTRFWAIVPGVIKGSLVCALALCWGCMTNPVDWARHGMKVGPNYSAPPAPVADAWLDASDPAVQKRQIDAWWQVFGDPKLNWIIDTACRQNLNLREAGMRVLEARALRDIAIGNFFPQTQQMTGQYSHTQLSYNTFNNAGALASALPAGSSKPPLLGNYYDNWSAGFNLSWELDFWGRFRRAIESANANLEASDANYDAAMVTLLADVATNYVQYRVAQQRIEIAVENVQIQESIVALAEQRYKFGTSSRLDVAEARTLLEQTRSAIPALEITLGEANDQLCTLLGIPPCDLSANLGGGTPLGADPMASVPRSVAVGIPADLLRRRPDVRSAERQVAAQSALIGVAEADLYPAFSIDGTLGWEAADFYKLFESKSFFGNISPGFQWNILNYGRIENNVHLQQAKTQELIAAYQNLVLTAAQEVQTSLRTFIRSREQVDALTRSAAAAVDATQVGLSQYKGGTSDFTTVFQLQASQESVQDELAVAQGNVALSLINVYRALGGGWEAFKRS